MQRAASLRIVIAACAVASCLFACEWQTSQDGNGNGSSTIGPADPATGTGSASLVCSAGERYVNVPLQRQFASIATCERHPDQTLLVHVGSDTCDTVTFSIPAYAGPGTYQGNVDVYTVEPNTGCQGNVGEATTFPQEADACSATPPPPCTIVVQGSASFTSKGDLELDATCGSFSFAYGGVCGTCTESSHVTAAIQDCEAAPISRTGC